ncbi:MAG: hypothetical protein JNJ73_08405 [Hyphomonadaceae bacterium]|nr:hypothetical protein [Hyphomonadaceae bacterium]
MAYDGDVSLFQRIIAPAVQPLAESRAQHVIRTARALIADEAHWRRGDFVGFDVDGQPSYCLVGALRFAHSGNARRAGTAGASKFVARAVRERARVGIQEFNDGCAPHEEILAVLDRAYELAA